MASSCLGRLRQMELVVCISLLTAASGSECRSWLNRRYRYKFSFYGSAFRAVVFLDCKVPADRMAFDYRQHRRPVTIGAYVVEI